MSYEPLINPAFKPPNQDTEVDEVLGGLVGKTLDHSQMRMPGEVQMYKMYIDEAKTALNNHYKSILLEVIGEDEPDDINKFPVKESWQAVNNLRQEQRQRLESRLG